MEEAPLLATSNRPAITFDRSSSYGSAIALEICGGVVAHLIFAIIFGVFLYDPSYYTTACSNSLLYQWANANLYYFIIASLLTTIVSPLMICLSKKTENSNKWCSTISDGILNFIRFGVGLMAIFLWVGLCVAYCRTEEDCGRLGSLIFFYIIIVSCAILIGCLVLVGLCFMFYLHQKSKQGEREMYSSQEFERINRV